MQQGGNTEKSPYLFTSKELDEETGLYYFGSRYYDPRTSVWQSADPILGDYLYGAARGLEEPANFALYTYGRNNPVAYRDADGNIVFLAIPLIAKGLALASAAYTGYEIGTAAREVYTGEKTLGQAAKEHGPGIAMGVAGGVVGKVVDKAYDAYKAKKALQRAEELRDSVGETLKRKHATYAGGP